MIIFIYDMFYGLKMCNFIWFICKIFEKIIRIELFIDCNFFDLKINLFCYINLLGIY